jgi:hypothetical protein
VIDPNKLQLSDEIIEMINEGRKLLQLDPVTIKQHEPKTRKSLYIPISASDGLTKLAKKYGFVNSSGEPSINQLITAIGSGQLLTLNLTEYKALKNG